MENDWKVEKHLLQKLKVREAKEQRINWRCEGRKETTRVCCRV